MKYGTKNKQKDFRCIVIESNETRAFKQALNMLYIQEGHEPKKLEAIITQISQTEQIIGI